jgi:hypothetical protein
MRPPSSFETLAALAPQDEDGLDASLVARDPPMKKARGGFPPGLSAHFPIVRLLYTNRVTYTSTKCDRTGAMPAPPRIFLASEAT